MSAPSDSQAYNYFPFRLLLNMNHGNNHLSAAKAKRYAERLRDAQTVLNLSALRKLSKILGPAGMEDEEELGEVQNATHRKLYELLGPAGMEEADDDGIHVAHDGEQN